VTFRYARAALASLVAQTGEAAFADKPIATDPDVAIERYFARAPHDSHFLASTTISHPLTAGWRCDPPRPEALLAHQAMVDLQSRRAAWCNCSPATTPTGRRPQPIRPPAQTDAHRPFEELIASTGTTTAPSMTDWVPRYPSMCCVPGQRWMSPTTRALASDVPSSSGDTATLTLIRRTC
jgi:hypothetical protein